MIRLPLSTSRPRRRGPFSQLLVASAAAALAAAAAAPAAAAGAGAEPAVPFTFAAGGAASGNASGLAAGSGRPAARSLQVVPVRPHTAVAAQALPPHRFRSLAALPKDASTGLYIAGQIHGTWNFNTDLADIMAATIENLGTTTSGDLTVALFATTSPPVTSEGVTGFEIAVSSSLGSLDSGQEFTGVDSGEVTFSPPDTNGCYYVSIVLLDDDLVADVRTFTSGGSLSAAQTNGYVTFPFEGGGSVVCPYATKCTRTATSACLDGARFQVSAAYDNTTTGTGSATVLSFGGSRAESDESVFFYFTDPSNFEMGAKILDACSINGSFWVFIGGLTNQGWGLDVLDTQTGNHKYYINLDGTTTVTITDTTALPCP
jgi:hypothetical protein